MSLRFLFRFDASGPTGLGHARRCRSLADALRRRDGTVAGALCRGEPAIAEEVFGDSVLACESEEHPVAEQDAAWVVDHMQRAQADILVLDTYHVDEPYQQILVQRGIRWLQFASLAGHPLYADWVLHASPGATPERYEPLRRRTQTRFLLGPAYAQLKEVYAQLHDAAPARAVLRRIALCFGGGDDRGATLQTLRALTDLNPATYEWDVIVGRRNPHLNEITSLLEHAPYSGISRLHMETGQVPQLLASADLGIIAGGTVGYEAAAVGLPMLLLQVADNQQWNIEGWTRLGAALDGGTLTDFDRERLRNAFLHLTQEPQRLCSLSRAGHAAVDGRGADRVAAALLG